MLAELGLEQIAASGLPMCGGAGRQEHFTGLLVVFALQP